MKNNFMKHAFVFSIITVMIAACNKYEDGPAFSLKTKKSRLCGEWVVESYLYNDVDKTADITALLGANFVLEIEKDGVYRTEGAYPDQGTWELGGDGDDVRMTSSDSGAVEISYRILRLKSKELWLKHTETNGDIEITKYQAK
jgi:hypothetical protein